MLQRFLVNLNFFSFVLPLFLWITVYLQESVTSALAICLGSVPCNKKNPLVGFFAESHASPIS